jgi:cytochrome b
METTMEGARSPTRVWDLPTRLFHWVLAGCVIGSVVSAKIGGNAMAWHLRLGYAVFTLLAFRLVWGLIGGHWSRFASFIYAPGAVLRYLRGQSGPGEHHEVGHSPLGALSVFGVLGLLGVQVASGLVSDDEISTTGPLAKLVSGRTTSLATAWHHGWGQALIIALALLHVVAIVVYLRRGRDLVRPMIVGDKVLPPGVPSAADHALARGVAVLAFTLCAAGVAWVVSLGG